MKKLLTIAVFAISLPIAAFSQSQVPGTLSFQLGYDLAIHGTVYRSAYNGLQLEVDTSAAVTTLGSVSAQYNFLNWLSSGITFDYGTYVEDTANANNESNHTGYVTLDIRAYPVNGEKFNLYIGPEFGFSFLEINRTYPNASLNETTNYKGGHLGINLGFNWYFVNFAGIFMQAEYTRNNFILKDFTIGNTAIDLTNYDITLDTYSGGIRMGLCFKID